MVPDVRYQVFISSTFKDLITERQVVLKAVLEMGHMPAGMELFPATDDSAWNLIKDVIDSSDYYVVIVGGRYGTLDEEGIGYTEREYDYAISCEKPVIPLLHKRPESLSREKTDTDTVVWEKLEAFRLKLEEQHTCTYWENTDSLVAQLFRGLTTTVARNPATGWIRTDKAPSSADVKSVLALRRRIEELEAELRVSRIGPPAGTETLAQGRDTFAVHVALVPSGATEWQHIVIQPSWDGIFAGIAPLLMVRQSTHALKAAVQKYLEDCAKIEGPTKYIRLRASELETCIIQLRALGLIAMDKAKTYWALTQYGDEMMVRLRALRKSAAELGDATAPEAAAAGNDAATPTS